MPDQPGGTNKTQDKLDVGLVTTYWLTEADVKELFAWLRSQMP